MKKIWLAILLSCLLAQPAQAQDGTKLYLPLITKSGRCEPMTDPILRVTDGTNVIDLLGPGSGWELADPYWQPQIAQFKGGGAFVDSGVAEGKQLVHREYDNVIETIPLSVTGIDQGAAIQTIRDLLQLGRQASDYYTESYEYDDVWLEAKPACANSLTGYSRIIKMSIPNLSNIFGQPFFSAFEHAVMEDLTLTIEREPFWRGTPPGEIVGPLYNLIKNPDFELWNKGTVDSQPDNWTDIETLWITGQNSRDTKPKWGNYDLKIGVSGSTKAGAAKGVTQVFENTKNNTEYTIVAWVRSDGISNGVGRILITYSSQFELYRDSSRHGWTLYTGKITTNVADIVAINCEILTTSANTDGTIYIDSLLFIEGDWEEEAQNGTLPYLSSSEITNRQDKRSIEPGSINYVDVWNIPGDVDSLIRLEIQNNTGGVYPPEIEQIIVGQRRLGDVFSFDNYSDVVGAIDLTASSSDSYAVSSTNSAWKTINNAEITGINNTKNNVGRFRLYARLYDNKVLSTTLQARTRYYIGTPGINDKILDTVNLEYTQRWVMVNLTPNAAVIFENKQSSNYPNQIGYFVEIKRSDGNTSSAKFDYSILMPTDGGFIEAIFNPPLLNGGTFLVDNTNSNSVSVFDNFTEKWNIIYTESDANVGNMQADFISYNGYLYFSAPINAPAGIKFYRYKPGENTITKTTSSIFSSGLRGQKTIYNNNLYVAFDNNYMTKLPLDLSSTTTITVGPDPASTSFAISDMIVFRDNLYIGGLYTVFAPFSQTTLIMKYDGTSVTLFRQWIPSVGNVRNMTIYNDELYISTANQIEIYNPTTGGWRTLTTPHTSSRLYVFNDVLYAATTIGIFAYGGGTGFSKVSSYSVTYGTNYDNELYLSLNTSGVYSSSNGDDWSEHIGLSGFNVATEYNNLLIGTSGKSVYYASTSGGEYKASDYKGSTFTAPPRSKSDAKRHRYYFIANRTTKDNNIADELLVGIGFVPRYLSLINYYPQ